MSLPPTPSVDMLLEWSLETLHELALKRWALADKLERQIRAMHAEIDRLRSDALLAHWLINNRDALLEIRRTQALQKTLNFVNDGVVEPLSIEAPVKRRVVNSD